MFSQFKIVRLTAQIFVPGDFELQRYAEAGLPMTQVDHADPARIADAVRDADIVSVIGTPMPRMVVDAMDKCRAIARFGTGTDKIDVARATERGIVVANTPYFCVEEQADHAMAMMLALNRKLAVMQHAMEDGDLPRARRATAMIPRMSACTLGLVGFGRSAVHTARRARGFGTRVLACRQNKGAPADEAVALGVTMTDFDTVLRESDYVSLHVPLTPATRNMIDRAAIAKMKPGACLINTSRGLLVDEDALGEALREGRLGGAGLDTFGQINIFVDHIQPPVHPLVGLENVILSPHVAGGSIQAKFDMMDSGIRNIKDILSGRWPLAENIVNPTVLPRFGLRQREGNGEPTPHRVWNPVRGLEPCEG